MNLNLSYYSSEIISFNGAEKESDASEAIILLL
jgi:hypothetical protein